MHDSVKLTIRERIEFVRFARLRTDAVTAAAEHPHRVVFVGGAARTGTTLLQNVLCSSSITNAVIAEAAPVRFLLEAHRLTANHTRVHSGAYFASADDVDRYFGATFHTFFDHLRKHHDCSCLVLKEPELTKSFYALSILVPEAVFLCTVSDPRDAIVSMLDWGERSRKSGRTHPFQQRDMTALSEFYMAFYRPFIVDFPAALRAKLRFIRYEDLVQHPDAMARQVERFTGLMLDRFNADADWSNCKLNLDGETSPIRDALTPFYGKPISDSKVGAYRHVLTADEVQVVLEKCNIIATAFDYHRV